MHDRYFASSIDVASLRLEPGAIEKIPRSLALRHDVLSVADDGSELTVVVPDARENETIERIRFTTGMHVRAISAPRAAIRARLGALYGEAEPNATAALDLIHSRVLEKGASDFHLEPCETGGRLRLRIDGVLSECGRYRETLFAQIVSRIKVLAGMDIADKRQPQDGRYSLGIADQTIDARVSSVPAACGEKIAVRILAHHAAVPALAELGLPVDSYERLRRICAARHGFIIASGPTGSGKTTTLYALLSERNVQSENLCSVEDPIEMKIPGITQMQVNTRAGLTFASAVRAFLRQDPDGIMIGELRDRETAAVAASASLSGQFLLTTLHSTDTAGAIERLAELGVSRRTIACGLTAVIGQRLVRRLCSQCKRPAANANEFEPSGCSQCDGCGYRGRCAIFEVLFVDDAMREAIAGGASSIAVAQLASASGFRSLSEHGYTRLAAGETSREELRRVLATECLW